MKILNLYSSATGYNNAAGILADKTHFPGIDMVKFGENISVIHKRATFDHRSILAVYEEASEIFKDYYQYEEIQGADRKNTESRISRSNRKRADSQNVGRGVTDKSFDV